MKDRTVTTFKAALLATAAVALAAPAMAQDTTALRIQTHFSAESVPGQIVGQFIDDVTVMSGGLVFVR